MHSRALATVWHVRVAIVAVVAPAHIAVGAARRVEAPAVLADAAIVGPLRRRRARRLVQRPVQDGRDHEAGRVAGVEKRQLDGHHVLPVAPPLLLHHEHAGAGRHPRLPSRGVRLQPGKLDVEGRGEASRDGRLAAADPVARPVLKLPLLGARAGWRARRAERGGGGVRSSAGARRRSYVRPPRREPSNQLP